MIQFRYDGRELTAPDGSSIGAALLGNGITSWRTTRAGGEPRGLFCGIGQCFDCLIDVRDREGVRACQEPLRPGDDIRPHTARSSLAAKMPRNPAVHEMTTEVAVVGAGPGGIAAALAAADAGRQVTLIDSAPRPGGQIWRQPAAGLGTLPGRFRRVGAHPGIALLPGVTVWHARQEPGGFVLRGTGGLSVRARAVVLATGAAELVLPFPGWTLPGVVTAGAAQALVKAHGTLPGKKVLVAGTGPLLLRAAADLVRHGAAVVAVCELARPRRALAAIPAVLRHPDKLLEGAGYAATLARARVPLLTGWAVTGCYGAGWVRQARVAGGGHSRLFAVDAVAVSHGLVPSLELARALGCRDEQLPGYPAALVTVDAAQATSTGGVFACGELTGIGGAAKAESEGTVAGHSAARYVGADRRPRAHRRAAAKVRAARRFAALLTRLYPVGDMALPPAATIICRCEEVTLAEVAAAVSAGAADLRAIKGLTRCGMGYCQGRVCGPAVQLVAARLSGQSLAAVGDLQTRHIGTPVTLGELAAGQ